ncbi:two-component response regulator-like PRR1 isoform X2 [Amborella trichopoda]|uniref:two-component response regulator-like PRR1 isoform X2 n=1 Tax=Amborella trichopoda TaxID=13333 RepID=UPI0009C0751D|nr:two-component response regulator-like PRR1 isoform X2 [Amborella trichopoda]|eukprot:XP_020524633.1 two-component response regulator-like PRR1 isoform X2 [Amborella trichopoda]
MYAGYFTALPPIWWVVCQVVLSSFTCHLMAHKGKGSGAVLNWNGDSNGNKQQQLLDRSKVRILLCDNDSSSSQEVLRLLCKCSYQVTSVRSARQVIDALNVQGPDIDIILAEVDLPISKGLKLLKYITRQENLRHIPIVVMSAQDDVSVVVKCLRYGAADYLVKPLRTNELLNLWIHMWRTRRMLGMEKKNILNHDFELMMSDPSSANTNSTTLFSDETDDKKSRRSTVPESSVSNHPDSCDVNMNFLRDSSHAMADVELSHKHLSDHRVEDLPLNYYAGKVSSIPKKSELKVGKSSAFFTYVKSSTIMNKFSGVRSLGENSHKGSEEHPREQPVIGSLITVGRDADGSPSRDTRRKSYGKDVPSGDKDFDVNIVQYSCGMSVPSKCTQEMKLNNEQIHDIKLCSGNSGQVGISGSSHSTPPLCMSGTVNHIVLPSAQLFQGGVHDVRQHCSSGVLPPYNTYPHCRSMTMMSTCSFYPIGVHLQPVQMPWPALTNNVTSEVKSVRVDKREAALIKFRQKRKDRCFDKKVRYVNRKRLAERRPRIRGQFVRQVNGMEVDTDRRPGAVNDSDEEDGDEDEDGPISSELGVDSSPEYDASEF